MERTTKYLPQRLIQFSISGFPNTPTLQYSPLFLPVFLIMLALLTCTSMAAPAATCPIAPPHSGFGANGSHLVKVDSVENPAWKQGWVYLFSPRDAQGPFPVVLFCHGIGATDPRNYRDLLNHLASRGNIVIYPSVKPFAMDPTQAVKYDILREGFMRGMRMMVPRADTARVGFVGHSYGGGAIPAMAWWGLTQMGWGANGSYLFIMAPWYSYEISQEQLELFPDAPPMIIQTYENDHINDPRMAIDLFRTLNIPASEKVFITLTRDSRMNYTLNPDHSTPCSTPDGDALDWYGVFKPLDALAAFAFTGDSAAHAIALGDGNPAQTFMGTWPDSVPVKPMLVTHAPLPAKEQVAYTNFWQNRMNKRIGAPGSDTAHHAKTAAGRELRTLQMYFESGRRFFKKGLRYVRALRKTNGPVASITTGYGANGEFDVAIDSFPSPLWNTTSVYVFHPKGVLKPRPVIFFCHGFSLPNPLTYLTLVEHMVSKGYVVVYSPYRLVTSFKGQDNRYGIMYTGFVEAVHRFQSYIDTTRIGFVGHSFGAGASPHEAWHCVNDNKWGSNGVLMYLMAPWYSFSITPEQLSAFPDNAAMIVQVFDNDRMNDPRIAMDIFTAIGIDKRNKNFVQTFSDTGAGYVYKADHSVPKGPWDPRGEEDALDYYGVYRLFDALADLVFNKNEAARVVALGNGSPQQTFMGVWPDTKRPVRPLQVSNELIAPEPDGKIYNFRWNLPLNPRRSISPLIK